MLTHRAEVRKTTHTRAARREGKSEQLPHKTRGYLLKLNAHYPLVQKILLQAHSQWECQHMFNKRHKNVCNCIFTTKSKATQMLSTRRKSVLLYLHNGKLYRNENKLHKQMAFISTMYDKKNQTSPQKKQTLPDSFINFKTDKSSLWCLKLLISGVPWVWTVFRCFW